MEHKQQTSGVGTTGLLGVAFVVLRLCGVIDWPWIWVTAPFWGIFVLAFVMYTIDALIHRGRNHNA